MLLGQQLLNGLAVGALYAMIAYSYSLIFGMLGVIFFAQGELIMLASFLFASAVAFLMRVLPAPLAITAGLAVSLALTVIVGILAEKVTLKPLRDSPRVLSLISSMGLSIILQNVVMLTWGRHQLAFPDTLASLGSITFLSMTVSYLQLMIIGTSILVFLALDVFFARSKNGLAIRAIAQDRLGATLMGIREDRTITLCFVITSALAFLTGLLLASYQGAIRFDMGFAPGIKGLTAAIVGGSGNVRGAFVAGVVLGLSETLFAGYVSSDNKDLLAFCLLIGILLIRPSGILGATERKG